MTKGLIIIRKPRADPIPDKKPNFPQFDCLHLELMENKKKLKKGLPLIPIVPRKPPAIKPAETKPAPSKEDYKPPTNKPKELSPKELRKLERKEKKKKKRHDTEEDEGSFFEISDDDLVGNLIGASKKSSTKEKYKNASFEEEDDIDEEEDVEEEEDDVEEEEEVKEEEEDDEYAGLTPEEREAKEKEEYIWRFKILKKQYKTEEIPSFNEYSDLKTMKTTYERTIRELYLDDTVETYRSYLLGGSMIVEFVCTKWVNIDMGGFVMHQTKMMYKYDRLLIELGERPYNQIASNLPVEARLVLLVLFQAGLFYLAKVIQANYGGTMADLFRGMTGQPVPEIKNNASSKENAKPAAGKMRGPRMKPEEIKKAVDNEIEDEDE